ncbi:hypothetical protein V2J09_010222 [Rumex salicifolius]
MQSTLENIHGVKIPAAATAENHADGEAYEKVRRLATGSAVVLFSSSGCCMCHVAKRLLFGLGVAPTVVELDTEIAASDVSAVLNRLSSGAQQPLPAVFVGGKLLGGVESLMTCHISGSLVPLLKEAGALWL